MDEERKDQIVEVNEIRTEAVIATEIRTIVHQTQKTMLDSAIEIGRRLVEAKELVPHGEWGAWLKDKVQFSWSTANNFMVLFEEYGDRQGTLFGAVSNSQTIGNLSYTKALKLLAIPEDEREEFAKTADAASISVRELDEKIKALQKEKDEETKRLERDIAEAEERLNEYMDRERNLVEELNLLRQAAPAPGEDKKAVQKLIDAAEEAAKKEREKAQGDIEKLKAKIAQMQKDHETILMNEKSKAASEAKAIALEEAEKERLRLAAEAENAKRLKEEAEKKLLAGSDEKLTRFRFSVEQFQTYYNIATGLLEGLQQDQQEKARTALKNIMRSLTERL